MPTQRPADRPFGQVDRSSRPMDGRAVLADDGCVQVHHVRPDRSLDASVAIRSIAAAATGGLAVGTWCRWAIKNEPSISVQGILAELGAPWIVVAFAVGAAGTGT